MQSCHNIHDKNNKYVNNFDLYHNLKDALQANWSKRRCLHCNFHLLFLRLANFVNIKTILQTIQALTELKNLRLFSWNLDLIAIFALLHVYRLKMKIYVSIDTHLSPLWEQWNKCHRKWHTMSLSAHKLVSIFFSRFYYQDVTLKWNICRYLDVNILFFLHILNPNYLKRTMINCSH